MIRKRTILLMALAGVALIAVACTGETTVVSETADSGGISVSGRGEVVAEPDTGYFSVGVEVTRKTVADAREEAASVLADVVGSLKDNGVNDDDLKTANFSIFPQYNYRNNEKPEITGFMVTNTLSVTVRDLDKFSETLDEAIEAGGDAVRVNSIRFDRDDKEKLIEQARELAMKDALAKAEQLAEFGDVSLGAPISIVESSSVTPPPVFFEERALAGADSSSTPIQPGTTSVIVTVSVRWEIGR
jgi:uncharacterized protein